jgi:WD40 repeat protein
MSSRLAFGHRGPVYCLQTGGSYVMSGAEDRTCLLFKPSSATLLQTYRVHNYEVSAVQIHPDCNSFFTGGSDRCVFHWDVETSKMIAKSRDHSGRVNALALCGNAVFSGSYDCTVRAWDYRSGKFALADTLKSWKDSVSHLAAGRDLVLQACSVDQTFQQYDLRRGGVSVDKLASPVLRAAQLPCRSVVLALTDDSLAQLDPATGQLELTYKGHANREFTIDVRATREGFVVGSENGEVCWFETGKSEPVRKLQLNSGVVSALTECGGKLIVGCHDGSFHQID